MQLKCGRKNVWKKTNDRQIRKMNVKQLAHLMDAGADLYCPKSIDGSVYCNKDSCAGCIEEWLLEEK